MKAKNIPKMPKDMPLQCKKWWKRIMSVVNVDILLPCDVFCLEMACSSLAVHERMVKDVGLKNDIYKGRNEDQKMLSDSEKILTMSFNQLLLSQDARNELMKHMPL